MANSMWVFSPLSCSLMSLLASRTHEWSYWTIAEGGTGAVCPSNVIWVELTLNHDGAQKKLRTNDLQRGQALDLFQQVQREPSEPLKGAGAEWNKVWESDKFLSEIDHAKLPILDAAAEWKLIRGSGIKPALYRAPVSSLG